MDFKQLDELYNSNDLKDIQKFYEEVESVEELVEFSRRRPKANVEFFKRSFDCEKKVIAVIPTADHRKFVDFFGGRIPEILVESRGPYFNYSHSMNCGVKEAFKYNPEWIVTCNDDLFEIDKAEKMLSEININKNKDKDYLLAKPGYYNRVWYHTVPLRFIETRSPDYKAYKLLGLVNGGLMESLKITEKFNVKKIVDQVFPIHQSAFKMLWRFLFLNGFTKTSFYNFGDFAMVKSETFKKVKFNELLINLHEDTLLSYELQKFDGSVINYRIGSFLSRSFGGGSSAAKLKRLTFGNIVLDYLLTKESGI